MSKLRADAAPLDGPSPVLTCCVGLLSRISRWIDDEEERTKSQGEMGVRYVVLDMGGE